MPQLAASISSIILIFVSEVTFSISQIPAVPVHWDLKNIIRRKTKGETKLLSTDHVVY